MRLFRSFAGLAVTIMLACGDSGENVGASGGAGGSGPMGGRGGAAQGGGGVGGSSESGGAGGSGAGRGGAGGSPGAGGTSGASGSAGRGGGAGAAGAGAGGNGGGAGTAGAGGSVGSGGGGAGGSGGTAGLGGASADAGSKEAGSAGNGTGGVPEAGANAGAGGSGIDSGDDGSISLPSGLVAYWKFNEGSGTTSIDTSGHGNDLTLTSPQWVAGKGGTGVRGLVSPSRISAGDKLNDVGVPFSIAVWLKFDQVTHGNGSQIIIQSEATVSRRGFILQTPPSGDGYWLQHFDASGTERSWLGNDAPLVGQWTHVAAVVTTAAVRLFVDGQEKNGTVTGAATSLASSTGSVEIARSIVDIPTWTLDEMRIYDRALSDGEVAQLAMP